ncbi:glutamate 5-kinase [Pseudomonas syringae]|uniref:glutamate 5-kinase n=1 Tax=Pseudomonas syringae TaxID=317 RepID=UPI003F76E1C4
MKSKQSQGTQGRVARWVIKIDSSMITGTGEALNRWVKEIADLHRQGVEIILVSPGAIIEGVRRLGWEGRSIGMPYLQAAAAIGQTRLVREFESSFQSAGIQAAQILLIHGDFADYQRYLNIKNTLQTLLDLQAVPVINENDTVSTEEIRFGDNDMIAALVANMMGADRLIIITERETVDTRGFCVLPAENGVKISSADDESLLRFVGGVSEPYQKKLLNKINAAKMFALSGGITNILSGEATHVLEGLRTGIFAGVEFLPGGKKLVKHKQWLAGHRVTRGTLVLSAEAAKIFEMNGGGISSQGVLDVLGNFNCNEMIQVRDHADKPVAQGLSNYSSREMIQIIHNGSSSLKSDLQAHNVKELICFQNIVLELYNQRM